MCAFWTFLPELQDGKLIYGHFFQHWHYAAMSKIAPMPKIDMEQMAAPFSRFRHNI